MQGDPGVQGDPPDGSSEDGTDILRQAIKTSELDLVPQGFSPVRNGSRKQLKKRSNEIALNNSYEILENHTDNLQQNIDEGDIFEQERPFPPSKKVRACRSSPTKPGRTSGSTKRESMETDKDDRYEENSKTEQTGTINKRSQNEKDTLYTRTYHADRKENNIPEYTVHCIIKAAAPEQNITKLSPFAIKKAIDYICGSVKSARPYRGNSILVETNNRNQIIQLMNTKVILNSYPITVELAENFDVIKGKVFAPELAYVDEDNLLNELKEENPRVQHIHRIKRRDDNPSRILIITFGGRTLPPHLKAGYMAYPVDLYIPAPLRCYKCQKFGHGSNSCRSNIRCGKCAEEHGTEECRTETRKCVNCNGEHQADNRECPSFKLEKEVVHIKYTQDISFTEARKRTRERIGTASTGNTYSQATMQKINSQNVTSRNTLTSVTTNKPVNTNPLGATGTNFDETKDSTCTCKHHTTPGVTIEQLLQLFMFWDELRNSDKEISMASKLEKINTFANSQLNLSVKNTSQAENIH